MLAYAYADFRFQIIVGILDAFALADGVVNQDDVALPGESLGEGLVQIYHFSGGRVAARPDNAGQWERPALGDVQVSGDKKTGPALENNVLYLVRVPLDYTCNARLERRLFRPGPEALLDLFANVINVRFGVGLCLEGFTPLVRPILDSTHRPNKIFLHHAGKSI